MPSDVSSSNADEGLSALLGYGSGDDSDVEGPSEPMAAPAAVENDVPAASAAAASSKQPAAFQPAAPQAAGGQPLLNSFPAMLPNIARPWNLTRGRPGPNSRELPAAGRTACSELDLAV